MGIKKKIIYCISDMHGCISELTIPECDILLIAGDVSRYGRQLYKDANWLEDHFNKWLGEQPAKHIVMTPGNHDIIFEKMPGLIPKINCHVLIDEMIEIEGIKIYGSPWTIEFYHWAFNLKEENLKMVWDQIPDDTDILLVHSPPYCIFDMTNSPGYPRKRIGSKSLKKRIEEVRPKYVIFGHNHGEVGVKEEKGITYINASLLDDLYMMVNSPILIEI